MIKDCPEWLVRTDDQRAMREFIAGFADHYRDSDVLALVDLYLAEQLPELEADVQRVFDHLRETAERTVPSRPDTRSRIARRLFRRNPLMGFEMDFSTPDQRAAFAAVAARSINSEAWIGNVQIFGSADDEGEVWAKLPADVLAEIIGASSNPDALSHTEFRP